MKRGNAFARIRLCVSLCVSVCNVTFETLDLESSFLVCRYIFQILSADCGYNPGWYRSHPTISEMTYNVSSGTLNHTQPFKPAKCHSWRLYKLLARYGQMFVSSLTQTLTDAETTRLSFNLRQASRKHICDLDPMTLIYKPHLKTWKTYLHTKNELSRSRLSKVTALQTNTQRHTQTGKSERISTLHSLVIMMSKNYGHKLLPC